MFKKALTALQPKKYRNSNNQNNQNNQNNSNNPNKQINKNNLSNQNKQNQTHTSQIKAASNNTQPKSALITIPDALAVEIVGLSAISYLSPMAAYTLDHGVIEEFSNLIHLPLQKLQKAINKEATVSTFLKNAGPIQFNTQDRLYYNKQTKQRLPVQSVEGQSLYYFHDVNKAVNAYVLVEPRGNNGKSIYIIFRGSDSIQNWVHNFKSALTTDEKDALGEDVGNFARGFIQSLNTVYLPIMAVVQSELNSKIIAASQLTITGHSLGGALAQLMFLMLYSDPEFTKIVQGLDGYVEQGIQGNASVGGDAKSVESQRLRLYAVSAPSVIQKSVNYKSYAQEASQRLSNVSMNPAMFERLLADRTAFVWTKGDPVTGLGGSLLKLQRVFHIPANERERSKFTAMHLLTAVAGGPHTDVAGIKAFRPNVATQAKHYFLGNSTPGKDVLQIVAITPAKNQTGNPFAKVVASKLSVAQKPSPNSPDFASLSKQENSLKFFNAITQGEPFNFKSELGSQSLVLSVVPPTSPVKVVSPMSPVKVVPPTSPVKVVSPMSPVKVVQTAGKTRRLRRRRRRPESVKKTKRALRQYKCNKRRTKKNDRKRN